MLSSHGSSGAWYNLSHNKTTIQWYNICHKINIYYKISIKKYSE